MKPTPILLGTALLGTALLVAAAGGSSVQAACELPPVTVCYQPAYSEGISFFDVTITFAPDNGTYAFPSGAVLPGWCLAKQAPIDTEIQYCGAVMTYTTGALPVHFQNANWGAVNWLINNRGVAEMGEVQEAIWTLLENEPVPSPAVQALVDAALANGPGFVPAPGQAIGVILDMGASFEFQPVLVEVRCQTPPPPDQEEYCFEAAEKKICNGTVDASFILDFGTGSRYLTSALRLVPIPDTTSATLTGIVYKAGSPSQKFNVVLSLTDYSDTGAQPGWVSYGSMQGTLTGLDAFSGLNLMVSSTGAVQIGEGANGLNPGVGIRAPFNWMYTSGGSGSGSGLLAGLAKECAPEEPPCVGTGTPGYWKNHSEAWPVSTIEIGCKTYTKAQAISLMGQSPSGDVTYTMFRHLVSAKLNVLIGNISNCITQTIADADAWLCKYPLGSCVSGSSYAWSKGSALATKLDEYNNGKLCAPSRDDLDCLPEEPKPDCDPKPDCSHKCDYKCGYKCSHKCDYKCEDTKPDCVSSPWKDKNLGNCYYGGSSKYDNGCYTVKGSGNDIWGNKDDCKYVFQNAYGDCEITAKVSSIGNTDPWAKAGVMIRESMNSDSKHAFACVTPSNGMAFQRRCSTGGASEHTSGGTGYSWIKLKRQGDTFTCYKSKDGYNWTKVGSSTIKMGYNCYIGFAVTSHNNTKTCEAKFTNTKISQ